MTMVPGATLAEKGTTSRARATPVPPVTTTMQMTIRTSELNILTPLALRPRRTTHLNRSCSRVDLTLAMLHCARMSPWVSNV